MKTEHFWQLFFVFVGAFSSAYAGYYFSNQPKDTPTLTYEYIANVDLNKTLGETGDITMIYNGKELNNLTKHLYTIANLSANDLGVIKLHFEFENEIYPAFYTIDENKVIPKKAIRLLSNSEGSYIYEIDFINKMDRIWNGLVFEFYFVGDEKPQISLKSGVKGLAVKERVYEPLNFTDYMLSGLKKLWWLISIAVMLSYLMMRYERQSKLVAKEKLKSALDKIKESVSEEAIMDIKKATEKEPSFSEVIRPWKQK
ncbi:hypothetical protein AB6E63_06435 [Vibrio cyclitrophicus]